MGLAWRGWPVLPGTYPAGSQWAGKEGVQEDGPVPVHRDWADRVLHPRYGHEREYEVQLAGEAPASALAALRRGVRLDEGVARAAEIRVVGRSRLRLVLRTGWKRQVRRMCTAVGLRVLRLRRVRMGPLLLGRLREGAWRELSPREVRALGGG